MSFCFPKIQSKKAVEPWDSVNCPRTLWHLSLTFCTFHTLTRNCLLHLVTSCIGSATFAPSKRSNNPHRTSPEQQLSEIDKTSCWLRNNAHKLVDQISRYWMSISWKHRWRSALMTSLKLFSSIERHLSLKEVHRNKVVAAMTWTRPWPTTSML